MPDNLPTVAMPTARDVETYLSSLGESHTTDEIQDALDAERSAQARVCRTPADNGQWPIDLAEALKRRTARNLSTRALPLGYQPLITDTGVGSIRLGWDIEIKRLEAPHRKMTLG